MGADSTPPATHTRRKVVLERTQGASKGTFQILGQCDVLMIGRTTFPDFLLDIDTELPRVEFASLIKVTPSSVYYREAFPRPKGKFGQQMDSFHPEQR